MCFKTDTVGMAVPLVNQHAALPWQLLFAYLTCLKED